jgi:hypothetical protein
MKCTAFLGLALMIASSASAQMLYTTTSDFAGWTANSPATSATPSVTYDYDGSTTNGNGNNPGNTGASINPGGTSAGGSLALTTTGMGYGTLAYSPGEAYSTSFMHTIDPGSLAAYSAESGYGNGTTTAYSGTMQITYTSPTITSGAYYQIGAFIKYDGHNYNPVFPSSVADDGIVDGVQTYTATIPYTIDAGSLSYCDFEIFSNSNSSAQTTFNIDDITVLPEPASIGIVALGALGLIRRRRA